MTGTPALCAASTMVAAVLPLWGATSSTSTPCVRRFSAWEFWSASFPLAAWTSTLAPSFSAAFTTSSRSRCQRSSLSVSIEKPMTICFPPAAPPALPAPPASPAPPPPLPLQPARPRDTTTAAVESRRMGEDLLMESTEPIRDGSLRLPARGRQPGLTTGIDRHPRAGIASRFDAPPDAAPGRRHAPDRHRPHGRGPLLPGRLRDRLLLRPPREEHRGLLPRQPRRGLVGD